MRIELTDSDRTVVASLCFINSLSNEQCELLTQPKSSFPFLSEKFLQSLDLLQNALLISSKLAQTSFEFSFDDNFTQNLNSEIYYALQCFK